jgi:YfiH family protein
MYVTSKLFQASSVIHGFSNRYGGFSLPPYHGLNFGMESGDSPAAVEANFTLLATRLGCRVENLVCAKQRHTDNVLVIDGKKDLIAASTEIADALVTSIPGVFLAVRTADCLPILIVDPETRTVAAVHAGWRGCLKRIIAKTVNTLLERGSDGSDLIAAIGPCIDPMRLRLAGESKNEIEQKIAPSTSLHYDSSDRQALYFDLKTAAFNQLVGSGVSQKNIEILDGYTYSMPGRYFSYRRDANSSARHLNFVGWPERI